MLTLTIFVWSRRWNWRHKADAFLKQVRFADAQRMFRRFGNRLSRHGPFFDSEHLRYSTEKLALRRSTQAWNTGSPFSNGERCKRQYNVDLKLLEESSHMSLMNTNEWRFSKSRSEPRERAGEPMCNRLMPHSENRFWCRHSIEATAKWPCSRIAVLTWELWSGPCHKEFHLSSARSSFEWGESNACPNRSN